MEIKTSYYNVFSCAILLLKIFQMPSSAEGSTSRETDQFTLLVLKSHITSDPSSILTKNWTNSSSMCNWIGVTCSLKHRRVTALNISNMSLLGTIPPQLGNLSFLSSLDLKYNFFSGTLPRELSLLRRLKFVAFDVNNLIGNVPSWFGLLPKLEYLTMRNNSLTGSIPGSLSNSTNLRFLDFSFNSIQGGIPEEIGRLHNLRTLMIENNHLSGVVPLSIYNISTLETIDFSSNEMLSGNLPNEICNNLPFLQTVALSKNQLSGQIPTNLSQCSQLQILSLSHNTFSGQIPAEIGQIKSLQILRLGTNNLHGVVPREIGQLHQLEELVLEYNTFNGSIPMEIFNISTLRILSLTANGLSGHLPTRLCFGSPLLEHLSLNYNYLSGTIPDTISNCSNLRTVSLGFNQFTGFVPHSLGDLRFLERLLVFENKLRTQSSPNSELTFITSLTNCRSLIQLVVGGNPLDGIIPSSIGNLSTSLQYFVAFNCKIKGSIPVKIGNLSNLIKLNLSGNELSGTIPISFKNLHKLQGLALYRNNLGGPIPEGLCDLQSFYFMYFSQNKFSGQIPECLGNVLSLSHVFLDSNMLISSIPSSLWRLQDLVELDLSSNFLSGSVPPDIGDLKAAIYINLSRNHLTKSIPSRIGDLQNLRNLSLAHNRLEGSIPVSIGSMISLVSLDLSCNNLSGSIPKSLEALQYLGNFNVSCNALSGEIPIEGPFRNFTMESFKDNKGLCANTPRFHVSLCHGHASNHRWKIVQFSLFIFAGLITVSALIFILLRLRRKDERTRSGVDASVYNTPQRISYYEILQATEHLNESNLLGIGSFGSVYKGIFSDGNIFAVKVFNLQVEARALNRSFDVECEVLRNIRHRNLIKVISSCSNNDFKALVLEYMPNGDLDNWLYSKKQHCLDVLQRLNIMIDVAFALEYLHYGYSTTIVHCDLKPSNVLLDEEMVAHVSDFGIAKLLGNEESIELTNTLATLGYIAPEYGSEGLVSTRCDVYSYGVMLMETFTRKRPSDDMFVGDLSLKSWIQNSIPESVVHVMDADLFTKEDVDRNQQCVWSILELALNCATESPGNRINIKQALSELQRIKYRYFCL